MPDPVEFYFDFASPYGYMGATRIGALAKKHGREVAWKPFLLGAVFKVTGSGPLPSLPMKGPYAVRDMPRSARFHGIPFKMPTVFPIATQAPARMLYWLESVQPKQQEAAVLALYRAYFVDDRNISEVETAAAVLSTLGVDRGAAREAANDPALKERLRNETQGAIDRGVFGSPYVFIDGEPFWGVDRFDQMDRWLAQGGF
jgi:2-hydroxychromene-2-carboxylate isomerase